MKIIDPGHVYELDWLDGKPKPLTITSDGDHLPEEWKDDLYQNFGGQTIAPNRLIFVKREGKGYPGNVGHHPGTNVQEVLRVLIDRVKYLDAQISHPSNEAVISDLRRCIWNLERRAAERHGRKLHISIAEVLSIETLPTCSKCGHTGCGGECHV